MNFLFKVFSHRHMTDLFSIMTFITALLIAHIAAAQSGAPTALSETFGSWQVNCQSVIAENSNPPEATKRICQMSQQQIDSKSGNTVIFFALDKPDTTTKATQATIILPFGVDLNSGISLQVDETEIANGPYLTCLPHGCLARVILEPAMLASLAKGKAAQISMKSFGDGQVAKTTLSLDGFTHASSRLIALAK